MIRLFTNVIRGHDCFVFDLQAKSYDLINEGEKQQT